MAAVKVFRPFLAFFRAPPGRRYYRYYRFLSSVGSWSRCTYPSIHFFVLRSRSVVLCCVGVVWCGVFCVCVCVRWLCVCDVCCVWCVVFFVCVHVVLCRCVGCVWLCGVVSLCGLCVVVCLSFATLHPAAFILPIILPPDNLSLPRLKRTACRSRPQCSPTSHSSH